MRQQQEYYRPQPQHSQITMDDVESKMLALIINDDRRDRECSKQIRDIFHTVCEKVSKK